MPDCLFCTIAGGEVPVDKVRETERILAFTDINPQAPVHVLVIPKTHYADLAALAAAGNGLLDEVAAEAHQVAVGKGIDKTGYRIVFNTGSDGGQTVGHAQAHVLGGRGMSCAPG